MQYLFYFPLFAILLVAYNVLMVMGLTETNPVVAQMPLVVREVPMELRLGDFLLGFGLILFFFEMIKATRYARSAVIDHMLSMVVFVIFLIELLVVSGAGTATFLLLTFMSLLDVVAGFTITISTARRDVTFGAGEN
ncbi:MAG: hypothetical protein RLZZ303_343 [Candidatus Hydrogenedentota bacterium]|jgi:hypothetical protein